MLGKEVINDKPLTGESAQMVSEEAKKVLEERNKENITNMTKEEAKHLSEVLKAYSEGKTVQFKVFKDSVEPWKEINDTKIEGLIYNKVQLRIKPEPKYRPYKNAEEFLKAEKEHGPRIITNYGLRTIAVVEEDTFLWNNPKKNEEPIYEPMAKLIKFKWQDGHPCGIVEE